jgi:MoaA/NifB/PqqE/SkfB family radical SAM enzyme
MGSEADQPVPAAAVLVVEPFLHFDAERVYNTLTDASLARGEPGFAELHDLRDGRSTPGDLAPALRARLRDAGWLVDAAPDLGSRFRLKYVSFEASAACNQACYFCPVSVDPREDHAVGMELYEDIVAQLAAHRATIEGVAMVLYNEPTTDRYFLDRVRVLKKHGLPPAVLTNATGLTPQRVDTLLEMGGLSYLSVNLSTLDRERYRRDRGTDHLPMVLRHLDYLKDRPLAPSMDMAVLGTGDETHRRDFEAISERFRGSRFRVCFYEVMDRAGALSVGLRPTVRQSRLCGCEQTGSRPVQWVHINAKALCVLCCQDYHEQHVVGDLREERLDDILAGPRMSTLRRWAYGMESAPDDFLCRKCVYARTR